MNFSRMLGYVFLCCLFVIACSNPDEVKTRTLNPLPPSKPLPPNCAETLLARLYWRADRKAFGYTVEVGTTAGVYSETHTLASDQTSFLMTVERGATYYLRATKYLTDNTPSLFQTTQIVAPTCSERSAYQKAHPNYVEPFDQLITWINK